MGPETSKSGADSAGAMCNRPCGGQVERLRAAVTSLVGECGYNDVKVGDIAARARVSRATFYELYADKEQCFLDAHRELCEAAESYVRIGTRGAGGLQLRAMVAALTEFAAERPLEWTTMTHEPLLAGPSAAAARHELLRSLVATTGDAERRSQPWMPHPRVLLGGAVRLLGIYARRASPPGPPLKAQLVAWAECYEASPPRARSVALRLKPHASFGAAEVSRAPRTLPRGRHRLPQATVVAIQRERIAYACAEALRTRTVGNLAVADIVSVAGLSREVFYTHFAGKQSALLAAQELLLERIMSVTAAAYFAPHQTWAERVLSASAAYCRAFGANPAFPRFVLDNAYAIGEDGARRADEAILAFGLLLESGRRERPQGAQLTPATCDAVAAALAELVATSEPETGVPVDDVLALVLAPFLGARGCLELFGR